MAGLSVIMDRPVADHPAAGYYAVRTTKDSPLSRAGRKRKIRKRTPSGQISRAKAVTSAVAAAVEAAAISVATEARARIYRLPIEVARDAVSGYPVGRLLWSGHLGSGAAAHRRHDAATYYARLAMAYQAAIDVPDRVTEPHSDEPRKPCPSCGMPTRCEECQANSADVIRRKWGVLRAELSPMQRAVLDQVVVAQLDWPAATSCLWGALDIVADATDAGVRFRPHLVDFPAAQADTAHEIP